MIIVGEDGNTFMEQLLFPGPALEHLVILPDAYDDRQTYPLVLCLHGYGANMEDLAGLAPVLDPAGYLYVFPNGPLPAFDGADPTMRTWYERGGNETSEAVTSALAALNDCVRAVLSRYRVPVGRALLVGFSQGGAMALRYGLPRPDVFAGIAVLSGSLRRLEDLVPGLPTTRKQSIFVGHGTKDSMVPVEYSRRLVDFLQGEGYRPFFRTYPVEHQISLVEMRDLRDWIQRTLPRQDDRPRAEGNQ